MGRMLSNTYPLPGTLSNGNILANFQSDGSHAILSEKLITSNKKTWDSLFSIFSIEDVTPSGPGAADGNVPNTCDNSEPEISEKSSSHNACKGGSDIWEEKRRSSPLPIVSNDSFISCGDKLIESALIGRGIIFFLHINLYNARLLLDLDT